MSDTTIGARELLRLVGLEKEMDEGRRPFVQVAGTGERYPFSKDVLAACGIESGSVVSREVLLAIMRFNLARLEEQIAYERGQALIREEYVK